MAVPRMKLIRIGDPPDWQFVNATWQDGPDDSLQVPESLVRHDGPGMQGHHYAFLRTVVLDDFRARFQFRLTPHSDVGIILRAKDPTHFHLLHFPNCGQASRAQNFWTAFSRMGSDGYLRLVSLELVRRVPSTPFGWLDAQVEVTGHRLAVRLQDTGLFRASDPSMPRRGRMGLYLFGGAGIRRLGIDGRPSVSQRWNARRLPRKNWFHPRPHPQQSIWQAPAQLVRLPSGGLLLSYDVKRDSVSKEIGPLLVRSADGGRHWSEPRLVEVKGIEGWQSAVIHIFPDSRLRLLTGKDGHYMLADTPDEGLTWSRPEPIGVQLFPPGIKALHLGPQALLNLADGSLLMFAYGGHSSTVADSSIYTWGSHHCQAFCCRSADGGMTWSPWVNIDGTVDGSGQRVVGNLDLTEVSAVQTGDGRILALARPIYSPWMWETWSSDGGLSWTPCMRGPFPGYAAPNIARTRSGAIVVAHRLPGCTIHVSLDDGRSWDGGATIDSAIWVMGGMVEVKPNTILYVYWDSFEGLMRAQFIRITKAGPMPAGRQR